MSVEQTKLIAIPKAVWNGQFSALAQQAERTAVRYKKAPPGDRREAQRYDAICRALEKMAVLFDEKNRDTALWWDLDEEQVRTLDAKSRGVRHPWSLTGLDVSSILDNLHGLENVDADAVLFELRQPFEVGSTVMKPEASHDAVAPRSPSEVWKAPESAKGVFAAIKARWRDQLEAAVAKEGSPVIPSGVNNQVLSEGLRDFVAAEDRGSPILARVVYRDGSEARRFPLRALLMKDVANSDLPILRVALMSMRHPEMDASIDAAWLRNSRVSLARPTAETDELVYETSRSQLRDLVVAYENRVCLHVYQTGLEPAVIGFYRAVTEHLIDAPQSIEVIPYFHLSQESRFEAGKPWATV
jgi:hypothetical protein